MGMGAAGPSVPLPSGASGRGAIGAIGAIGAVGSSSSASAAAKEAPKKLPPLSRDQLVAAALADGLLGGSDTAPEAKLFVKNLPGDMDDLGLYRLFSPFGALVPGRVKAMAWPDGKCKGHGFVDFAEQLAAEQAMTALHGFEGLHVVQAEATGRSAPAPAAAPQPDEEDEDERAFQEAEEPDDGLDEEPPAPEEYGEEWDPPQDCEEDELMDDAAAAADSGGGWV